MRVFFTPVEGVEAVGSHQVRFHLNKPWGPMLATLAQATEMVNEKALQAKDPKLFPIGTGPYKFVEWVKDDHVTLERWDKYFRPSQPYIDRIIFNAPADDTVRLTGLQTGKFNWIQTVPPQRIPELERARDMKSSPGRPYFPFFFMLNASRPPLGDKRIRQAISWALDRSEIVKLVYYGSHVVTAEPTPEPSPWATGVNAHKGGPDLARAKQLMNDAGVGSGLTLTYLVKSQVPVLVKTGEILREQLKKIGITLDVRPLSPGNTSRSSSARSSTSPQPGGASPSTPTSSTTRCSTRPRPGILRLQVRGGRPAAGRLPHHGESRGAQENVPRSWCGGSRRKARS